ncbi:TPA: hypothetical protein ACNIFV_003003 [Enterococcus faecium]
MIDRKNDLAIENEKLRKQNLELRKENVEFLEKIEKYRRMEVELSTTIDLLRNGIIE